MDFNDLIKNRPSIIRNSFLVYLVLVSFWILTFTFSITGLACIIGGDIQKFLILDPLVKMKITNNEIANLLYNNTRIAGICLLILGVLSSLVIWLCRKLIERNLFIMEMERWSIEQKEENLKKGSKTLYLRKD